MKTTYDRLMEDEEFKEKFKQAENKLMKEETRKGIFSKEQMDTIVNSMPENMDFKDYFDQVFTEALNFLKGKNDSERVFPEINEEIEAAIDEGIRQSNAEGISEEDISAIVASHPEGIAPDGVNEREWLERALRDMPDYLKTFEEGLKQGLYDDLLKEYGYERQNNE